MRLLLVIIIVGFMAANVNAGQGSQNKAGNQTQQQPVKAEKNRQEYPAETSPAGQQKVRAQEQHQQKKGQAKQKAGTDPKKEMDGALHGDEAQKGKGKKKNN